MANGQEVINSLVLLAMNREPLRFIKEVAKRIMASPIIKPKGELASSHPLARIVNNPMPMLEDFFLVGDPSMGQLDM